MSDVTEVPLAPEVFWGCVAALALGLFSWVVYKVMPRSEASAPPFTDIQSKLGLSAVPAAAFWVGALLWLGLLLILVAGLYAAIWDMLWQSKEFFEAEDGDAQFRFLATRLAGTTAVLGVVVAFPVTLNRLKLTREQNETAREALFNQKITEAAADLHAQRQVTLRETFEEPEDNAPQKRFNGWEDDVVRRTAAIDRLEGLVRERPDREIAERVARILSMYVRELSRETWPAKTPPETDVPEKLRQWANGLHPLRSDMGAAVVTLSRLAAIVGLQAKVLPFDLRESNLQRARLAGHDLRGADLSRAKMQGASLFSAKMQGVKLSGAKMQGADLKSAKMQEADLSEAEMQGANLSGTKMQGAGLVRAKMQGAKLREAEFSEDSVLTGATLRGASVRYVDDATVSKLLPFRYDIFADSTVQLPEGVSRPDHWHPSDPDDPERLNDVEFLTLWRDWQRSIGQDPEKPE